MYFWGMLLTRHPDHDSLLRWYPEVVTIQRFLGYWGGSCNPEYPDRANVGLPDPKDFVDESWDLSERLMVADYLRHGRRLVEWRGYSWCRFRCDAKSKDATMMGSYCLTDGTFAWPEGFAHYVEAHAVRPPEEFVAHVRGAHPV